jgi:hypothetical protein
MTQYQQTGLWNRVMVATVRAEHSEQAERLRVALARMRERAAVLVAGIHDDCRGITVHDVTHLDALWDVADAIVGPDFPFTPAELFVLGGAILIHDAGMSVAAYPGGMAEIEATLAWKENFHGLLRREGQTQSLDGARSMDIRREALFATLRDLHAEVAEQMATQSWPGRSGDQYHLIEDDSLRDAYGVIIGRVAHSHHWDAERLLTEFHQGTGAAPGLPAEWTINEVKVAFVLRCADAAHIDSRRAPSFRFALSKPHRMSAEHWTFQNKLKQCAVVGGELVYASGKDFLIEDVAAWWRAYEAVGMIHGEIEKANNLLIESGSPQFAVRGVAGANNPRRLARYIKPSGWEPVRAEITVSDPTSLAQRLGGKHLYGSSSIPPIRELLQNAADAVRARRKLENREENWGEISVAIEDAGDEFVWLHVSDNGIGMSQAVLTGPLVDFGKSIWGTGLLRQEFPGLASSELTPIGKFGIGFFSVFLLGEQVRVVSKRYDQGHDRISILVFDGIGARPILLKGSRGDLPLDWSTRVSVKVKRSRLLVGGRRERWRDVLDGADGEARLTSARLMESIHSLVASLDVRVSLTLDGARTVHDAAWTDLGSVAFLEELYGQVCVREPLMAKCYAELLQPFKDERGNVVGRAALALPNSNRMGWRSLVSVGGFSIEGSGSMAWVGVLPGDVVGVTREAAVVGPTREQLRPWLEGQADVLSRLEVADHLRVGAARALFRLGLRATSLPICFLDGRIQTLGALMMRLCELSTLRMPVRSTYSDNFEMIGIHELDMDYATMPMAKESMVLMPAKEDMFSSNEGRTVAYQNGVVTVENLHAAVGVRFTLELLRECWRRDFSMKLVGARVFERDVPGFSAERRVLELTALTE